MAKVTKIESFSPAVLTRKRVAAYARVSMDSENLRHSLSAQISRYSELIQSRPEWEYAGVYADSFVSGTSIEKRTEFQKLLADCDEGKIDIILCKSISRFARNTVDLLGTIRHLKNIGVDAWFEKENIRSLSGEGELMLTIMASFAQEESESISQNIKWSIRKRFEQGIPRMRFRIYGYRWKGDTLVIVPEEAAVIQLIYENFFKGMSLKDTEKQLREMGVKSPRGGHFSYTSVRNILGNITYTGNLLLQKGYTPNPIEGKPKVNHGELPMYFVENSHEAIISLETYEKVQKERKRRKELGALANPSATCFTAKIKCGGCGATCCRGRRRGEYIWLCDTYTHKGKASCSAAKILPEKVLKKLCAEVLGTDNFEETVFLEKLEKIVVTKERLDFYFKEGSREQRTWHSTARKDAWTEKRRQQASERQRRNPSRRAGTSCLTGKIRCGICGANFNRKIDLIITKSVSRFARNTVDSLTTIRKLKEHGVEVYFEKENIWTFDGRGELLITIMSSLAQEESRSISENCTWGQRKRMADGKVSVPFGRFLGYDRGEHGEHGELVVNEKEAEVVKDIYQMFLEGMTPYGIAKELTRRGIRSPGGKDVWYARSVLSILQNELQ